MTGLVRFCSVAIIAAAGLSTLTASASYAEDCKTFGAVGSGLNESIATLMAKQGAVNVSEGRGYKPQGEAKLISCEAAGVFGTECKASVRACKTPN